MRAVLPPKDAIEGENRLSRVYHLELHNNQLGRVHELRLVFGSYRTFGVGLVEIANIDLLWYELATPRPTSSLEMTYQHATELPIL